MKPEKQYSSEDARASMLRYLEGTLSEEELAAFNLRLKEDLFSRKEAAGLLLQELHLIEIAQEEESMLASDGTFAVRQKISQNKWSFRRLLSRPVCRIAWLGGLAVLAAVLSVVLRKQQLISIGLRLVEVHGEVVLENQQREWPVTRDIQLKVGDQLNFRSGASATLRFQGEATSLRFSESARFRIESLQNRKAIRLQRGLLLAVVAAQPRNAPLTILTPHAKAEVLGTEFSLSAGEQKTRLEVWEGKVRLRRVIGDAAATVTKGQFAVAAKGVPLVNQPMRRGVLWEYWLGVKGQRIRDLTGDPRFPDRPTGKDYLTAFEAPTGWADDYGGRVRGYLRPSATGFHTFWIAGDDEAELWLSTDENPENKIRICWTETWTRPREWDNHSRQKSAPVALVTGRRYYIEARHKEAGGFDCLAVAWKTPNREREIVSGNHLIPLDDTLDLGRLESGRDASPSLP